MKKNVRILVALWIGLMISSLAGAASEEVETVGESALSMADAIRQAQRAAVEEGVGVFIQSETEMENFILKKDKIFSRTEGYVTRFNILEQKRVGDLFQVRIRATVSLDKIKDDLIAMKILLESMERPKLMVLVEEFHGDLDNLDMGMAAAEISGLLIEKGFEVVDRSQLRQASALSQARQALAGDVNAAKNLGLQFDSQYVVVGKAVVRDAGEAYAGSGFRSLHASLQLKVVQSQTGLILGSTVKNGVAAHVSVVAGASEALKKASRKVVNEYLVDAVTHSFQSFLNNGVPLKLHITGVTSFREYKKVNTSVGSIHEVVSSKKEGWNKAGAILLLDLRFKGTSEDLAEILDGRKIGEKELEVTDFAPERVDCRLQ